MTETNFPLCKDCKHYSEEFWRCRAVFTISPIDGCKDYETPLYNRGIYGKCGPTGKLFEQRLTFTEHLMRLFK